MLIHLIRHTTPDIEPGICYGQTDLDVVDSFNAEKDTVLSKLHKQYDAVYTSPLQRCSKLAEYVNSKERLTDKRIMEYNFGDWECLPWSELTSDKARHWMDNFVEQPAPNGESMLTMQARVMPFFDELFSKDYERVAVVTHSGVQRLLHAHILETPLTHLFRLQLEFGAVLEITHNNDSNLLTVKHL